MQYVELRVEVARPQAEALSAWLVERAVPFQEADETTLDPPPKGRVRFHLFVPPGEGGRWEAALREAAGGAAQVSLSRRDETEWRDAWKRYFSVRRIGRLALVPSWEAAGHHPADGEVTLRLDPGRAFGTGGHESTRLCLRQIDGLATEGHLGDALDVGCGSGVLAIAVLLYDAGARATAIDIDPEALEVTAENAAENGVGDRLARSKTPLAEVRGTFPLVLANLSGPTLLSVAGPLCQRVAPGGHLVLSGILTGEAAGVRTAYEALGLSLQCHECEGEWSALRFERPA